MSQTLQHIFAQATPDYNDGCVALIDQMRPMAFDAASDVIFLAFVRNGSLSVNIDGVERVGEKGQIVFVRPGHSIGQVECSADFAGHAILLSVRFGQQILAIVGNIWRFIMQADTHPVITLPKESMDVLKQYYKLLRAEVTRRESMLYTEVVASIVRAMLCTLISDVMRSESRVTAEPQSEHSPQALALFQRFMSILNNEMCVERKIQPYAARLCVTPKYLSLVCSKIAKQTPHSLIRNAVVNGISNHLRYSNLSPKEIAVLYGFPNLSFFSKYVKKHIGATPSALRSASAAASQRIKPRGGE